MEMFSLALAHFSHFSPQMKEMQIAHFRTSLCACCPPPPTSLPLPLYVVVAIAFFIPFSRLLGHRFVSFSCFFCSFCFSFCFLHIMRPQRLQLQLPFAFSAAATATNTQLGPAIELLHAHTHTLIHTQTLSAYRHLHQMGSKVCIFQYHWRRVVAANIHTRYSYTHTHIRELGIVGVWSVYSVSISLSRSLLYTLNVMLRPQGSHMTRSSASKTTISYTHTRTLSYTNIHTHTLMPS